MTGAVIRAFMILTASPVKAIVFLGLIVILQQLEGNLIYPVSSVPPWDFRLSGY